MKFIILIIAALVIFGSGPFAHLATKLLCIVLLVMLVFKLPGIISALVRPRRVM